MVFSKGWIAVALLTGACGASGASAPAKPGVTGSATDACEQLARHVVAVVAESVLPIWGHPPAAGDTFAACDDYLALLRRLATWAGDQDPHLADRIAVLETERRRFDERSPRVRGMWSGYCVAEAARRRELVSARGACAPPSPIATPDHAR